MKYKSLIIAVLFSLAFSFVGPVFADVGDAQVCSDAQTFCTERVCSGNYDPDQFDSCIVDEGCSQHFASPPVGTSQCPGYVGNNANLGTTDPVSGGGVNDPVAGGGVTDPVSGAGGHTSFRLENPLKFKTIEGLITAVIKLLMQIGLSVAILFIVYAGFLFVTAGGNAEKVTKAKQVLLWAVIGTAVLLGSLVIMSVIQNTIKDVTTTT